MGEFYLSFTLLGLCGSAIGNGTGVVGVGGYGSRDSKGLGGVII